MDNESAVDYLGSLLEKRLRLHTTDKRMFVGDFKCTDSVSFSGKKGRMIPEIQAV